MEFVRTPDERFENLSGYDFEPNYFEIAARDGTALRIHYLDEGPRDGETILCMHGQPSWSYLYRKMIPLLTAAGYRVIAPDLIGFGRSDKPSSPSDYTYQNLVDWMGGWLTGLDLKNLSLVCQDWGGLIGLRLVGDHPERFNRLIIANTMLPSTTIITDEASAMIEAIYDTIPVEDIAAVKDHFEAASPGAFIYWVKYAAHHPSFSVPDVFEYISGVQDEAILAGYGAPFPGETYLTAPRKLPSLVPLRPEARRDREQGDAAWEVIEKSGLPVLLAFSDGDPVTNGGEQAFLSRLKHAKSVTIKGGSHFLQEDAAQPFSEDIISFMRSS